MTNQERQDHNIIDGKRPGKEIAKGSGTTVQDVNHGFEAIPADAHDDEAVWRDGRRERDEGIGELAAIVLTRDLF